MISGYDDWKLRTPEDQEERDRAWARRGRRESDPDRDDPKQEAEDRDE